MTRKMPNVFTTTFKVSFSALTLLVGRKKTGCWFVGGDDLTGALHDLWLQQSSCYHHLHHPWLQQTPANLGSSGKWPLKRRERDVKFLTNFFLNLAYSFCFSDECIIMRHWPIHVCINTNLLSYERKLQRHLCNYMQLSANQSLEQNKINYLSATSMPFVQP